MTAGIPIAAGRAAAALALVLFAVESMAQEVWQPYGPAGDRFRVEFPAEPELTYHEAGTPFGSVQETRYTLRTEEGVLIAESHELPALAVALMPDRVLLNRAQAGVIDSEDGVAIESRVLEGHDVPAQEFTYRLPGDPPRYQRARAFLDGGRLYLLLGTASRPGGPAPWVERFFESFRFWKEGENPPELVDSRNPSE